jgi:hypothetical protein
MAGAGFASIDETPVELRYKLFDIEAYRDKAYSPLHPISEDAFRQGIAHMERALATGAILCVASYLLLWGNRT